MEPSQHITTAVRDARARVLWGEPVDEVRTDLLDAGVDETFAANVIQAALAERVHEARVIATKRILIGVGILALFGVPLVGIALIPIHSMTLFGLLGAGAAYGFIRIGMGLYLLLLGADFTGAVSDLEV